jgi:hypothetical protein
MAGKSTKCAASTAPTNGPCAKSSSRNAKPTIPRVNRSERRIPKWKSRQGDANGAREMVLFGQRDLFQDDEQDDLFGDETPTPEYRADPDIVRQELYRILAQARAARTMPWDAKRLVSYRTIFPQMTTGSPSRKRRSCASNSKPNWHGWQAPEPTTARSLSSAGIRPVGNALPHRYAWKVVLHEPGMAAPNHAIPEKLRPTWVARARLS